MIRLNNKITKMEKLCSDIPNILIFYIGPNFKPFGKSWNRKVNFCGNSNNTNTYQKKPLIILCYSSDREKKIWKDRETERQTERKI